MTGNKYGGMRISQWLYTVFGLWWAFMAMPFLGFFIAAVSSGDEGTPFEVMILDPAVWVFPVIFAVVGLAWAGTMVLIPFVTERDPVAGADLSLAVTGLLVGRHEYLRHDEREQAYWRQQEMDRRDRERSYASQQQMSGWRQQTPPALQLSDPFSPPPNWNQASFSPFHGQMTHDCTPACPRYQW